MKGVRRALAKSSHAKKATPPTPETGQRYAAVVTLANRRPWVFHVSVYALLVAIHLASAAGMRYPGVHYDELEYLGFARYLAGVQHGLNLGHGALAYFGYPLFLMPAFWMASTFFWQYRLALAINALLISSNYFSLCYLISRLTSLPRLVCMAIALVTCLYPSFLAFSNFAISDNVFVPLYLLVLVALYQLLETQGWWAAALLGSAAGTIYMTSPRGASVLGVVAIFAIVLAARGRLPLPQAGLLLAMAVTVYFVTQRELSALGNTMSAAVPASGPILRISATGPGFKIFLLVLTGELVYLCQVTFCLYPLGWKMLFECSRRMDRGTGKILFLFVAVTSLIICLGAAIFIAPSDVFNRPDHLLIGRYNEDTLAVVLAFSLAVVYQASSDARWRKVLAWWAVASAVFLCVGTLAVAPFIHRTPPYSINTLGNAAFMDRWQASDASRGSLLVLPLAALVYFGARKKTWAGLTIIAVLFAFNGSYDVLTVVRSQSAVAMGSTPAKLAPLLQRLGTVQDTVYYDLSVWDALFFSLDQLLAPERFEMFSSEQGETPRSSLVIAGRNWKDAARLGYFYVASESDTDNALWVSSPDLVRKALAARSFVGVEIGSRVVAGVNTQGLYQEERTRDDCIRWTDGHAKIIVSIYRDEMVRKVAMTLSALQKTRTRLLLDGAEVTTLEVGPGPTLRILALDPPASGRVLTIGVESATFVPGPQDSRTLGVQVRSVMLLP